jgi:hypothetical protein
MTKVLNAINACQDIVFIAAPYLHLGPDTRFTNRVMANYYFVPNLMQRWEKRGRKPDRDTERKLRGCLSEYEKLAHLFLRSESSRGGCETRRLIKARVCRVFGLDYIENRIVCQMRLVGVPFDPDVIICHNGSVIRSIASLGFTATIRDKDGQVVAENVKVL